VPNPDDAPHDRPDHDDPTVPPLTGVRVVEVALGQSVVGAGMASGLAGALLRDLGADVVRVQSATGSTLDRGLDLTRSWQHGKDLVEVDGTDPATAAPDVVTRLAADADVLLLAGPETLLEQRGLGLAELTGRHPRLVGVRIRPSADARGPIPDLELLVAARAGLPSQFRGHRPGPVFPTLPVAGAGAALSATVGALALLYQREATGRGGWAETSLHDGLQALLPMIIGRVEHHSPSTNLLWREKGPAEGLAYRCADGEYVQLWFGAKGAYEAFLAAMDDEPSEKGYNADLVSGAMTDRARRWSARLATRDRADWLRDFAGAPFRAEPVLRPGEALLDEHVREIGLARESAEPDPAGRGPVTVLGPLIRVARAGTGAVPAADPATRLLADVKVLDLSAFLAGPIAPLVLAELGADVVKVEPVTGDVHRNMEPMFAAGQRGKRAVAVDLKSPGAADVLARLFRRSDVVHHNSRVGLSDRLGYDEATVRAANPGVVYSFASGFGETGPRALLPANDHLMQALSGAEAAQGGAGRPPTFVAWGAIDVAAGWVAACGILAGLYDRRRTGGGRSVSTSLLGASLALQSGAFVAGGEAVAGPVLDAEQTGYGAAYRLYRGADGGWFALAVPDAASWTALRTLIGTDGLPDTPPPLRTDPDERQPAEATLETAFAARDAATWVASLRAAGVPVEAVHDVDRSAFGAGFVTDPVGLGRGRVVSYSWGERGRVDQPAFPPAFGPEPGPGARRAIAGLGEHTAEVLAEVGLGGEEVAALAAAGTIRLP
jgi:crotonobetainyl-CoA:carnitine CoA-transferase CaiB-like acyl-CoA transferase